MILTISYRYQFAIFKIIKLIWISVDISSRLCIQISHRYHFPIVVTEPLFVTLIGLSLMSIWMVSARSQRLTIEYIKKCHVETFYNKLSIIHVDIDDIVSISIHLGTHIMLLVHCTFVICKSILCVHIIVKHCHLDFMSH